MNSNQQVEKKEVVVIPPEQLRYLVLAMEADRANDEKKIKEIKKEAATVGIQM